MQFLVSLINFQDPPKLETVRVVHLEEDLRDRFLGVFWKPKGGERSKAVVDHLATNLYI